MTVDRSTAPARLDKAADKIAESLALLVRASLLAEQPGQALCPARVQEVLGLCRRLESEAATLAKVASLAVERDRACQQLRELHQQAQEQAQGHANTRATLVAEVQRQVDLRIDVERQLVALRTELDKERAARLQAEQHTARLGLLFVARVPRPRQPTTDPGWSGAQAGEEDGGPLGERSGGDQPGDGEQADPWGDGPRPGAGSDTDPDGPRPGAGSDTDPDGPRPGAGSDTDPDGPRGGGEGQGLVGDAAGPDDEDDVQQAPQDVGDQGGLEQPLDIQRSFASDADHAADQHQAVPRAEADQHQAAPIAGDVEDAVHHPVDQHQAAPIAGDVEDAVHHPVDQHQAALSAEDVEDAVHQHARQEAGADDHRCATEGCPNRPKGRAKYCAACRGRQGRARRGATEHKLVHATGAAAPLQRKRH